MIEIENLINALADALRGHNALIQVQVGSQYLIRKVGDINRLAERTKVQVVTADASFLDWMSRQVEAAPVRESTRTNHRNCLGHLRRFRPVLRFTDIDHALVADFARHLRASGLSVNTTAKVLKVFRRYVNAAMDDDIFVTNAFRKFQISTEHRERQALTERELRRMEGVTTVTEEEQRVKESFLLAVYTGLRYSDVQRTKRAHIKRKWLVLHQRKTGREVRIPVGSLFGGKALPLIGTSAPPNARCNVILHRLCRRAHIRKHVTMHTARRTCATLLTARGIPLPVVQRILGHESVRTTEGYIAAIDGAISRAVRKAFR